MLLFMKSVKLIYQEVDNIVNARFFFPPERFLFRKVVAGLFDHSGAERKYPNLGRTTRKIGSYGGRWKRCGTEAQSRR